MTSRRSLRPTITIAGRKYTAETIPAWYADFRPYIGRYDEAGKLHVDQVILDMAAENARRNWRGERRSRNILGWLAISIGVLAVITVAVVLG